MAKSSATGLLLPVGSFVAGILLFHFLGRGFPYAGEAAVFCALLFLVILFLALKRPLVRRRRWAGVAGLVAIALLGFWRSSVRNTLKTLPVPEAQITHYRVTVNEAVAVKPTSVSTVGELSAVQANGRWYAAQGKVALFFPRTAEAEKLQYGQQLLVKGAIQAPPLPANPFQFNYRQFLERKYIQWQVYVPNGHWLPLSLAPPSKVEALSLLVRKKLEKAFKEHIPWNRERAIAQALVLGVKDELEGTLRSTYARTGTMHILAVSGLHVGVLYLIFVWLLTPLRGRKGGVVAVGIFIIALIWFYAFLTGLSPSVLRSATMFSLVEMARLLKRRASVLNSLGIAAFVLLLYNPNYLLEVGFQLSFVAVAGIVLVQPLLSPLLNPKGKILRYVWSLFTVSLAAQLATFPLGLYYFHQFPVYFWLTNLVAVPLAFLGLCVGLLFMVFSFIPWLAAFVGIALASVLWIMNEGLGLVEAWPQAVVEGVAITAGQTVALYLLLMAAILFLVQKRLPWLVVTVVAVAFLSGTELAEASRQRKTRELVIHSARRSSAVSVLNGRRVTLLADSSFAAQPLQFTYNVQPYWWERDVREEHRFKPALGEIAPKPSPPVYKDDLGNQMVVWQGKKLFWLRKLPPAPQSPIPIDVLVLQHNVWLEASTLPKYFVPRLNLLDGTNSTGYSARQVKALKAAGYQVRVLAQEGAFLIRK